MKKSKLARYYLSPEGLAALKDKLTTMYQERKALRKRLKNLRNEEIMSNTADSMSWMDSITTGQFLEKEIERIERILARVKLITRPRKFNKVTLGCQVYLVGTDKELHYEIVSSLEADPTQGKISDQSPLGKALMGKTVSDYISWQLDPKSPMSFLLKLVKID